MTEPNETSLTLLQTRVAPEIARRVRVAAAERGIPSAELLRQFIADELIQWTTKTSQTEGHHVR